jgi:hypothetical protein
VGGVAGYFAGGMVGMYAGAAIGREKQNVSSKIHKHLFIDMRNVLLFVINLHIDGRGACSIVGVAAGFCCCLHRHIRMHIVP